jgi:hypothetical protein
VQCAWFVLFSAAWRCVVALSGAWWRLAVLCDWFILNGGGCLALLRGARRCVVVLVQLGAARRCGALLGSAWGCLVVLGGAWWCLVVLVVLGGAWRCSECGSCCLVLLDAAW